MNNTAAIQTAAQPTLIGRTLFGGQSATETAAANGDFLAMILQMLGNTGVEGEAENPFAALVGEAQGDDGDEEEQDPNQLAMQMMAELFDTNTGLADTFLAMTDQTISQLRQSMSMTDNPALQQLVAALAPETKQQPTDKSTLPYAQLLQGGEKGAGQDGGKSVSEQLLTMVQTAGQTKGDTQSETSLLGGQSQFQSAVMEAQKLMKDAGKTKPEADPALIDIDKLQQAVDTGRYNGVNDVQKQSLPLNKDDLVAQLKNGAAENLKEGKNEFTVKLKPEGLGEITVKLTENAGKTTLSLITSDAHTTKLLMGELAALRETMRPYHVEVREVVTQSENASSNLAQNEQFSQSFGEHQHQQFEQNRHSYAEQLAEQAENATDAIIGATLPQTELDTYI